MAEELKKRHEGDPKYPFVKFMKMKKYKVEGRDIEAPTEVYVNVSGVHGSPEAMLEFEKAGSVLIGYGNLGAVKYGALRHYCDARTGHRMHPDMKAALANQEVMNGKIEKARAGKPNQ